LDVFIFFSLKNIFFLFSLKILLLPRLPNREGVGHLPHVLFLAFAHARVLVDCSLGSSYYN